MTAPGIYPSMPAEEYHADPCPLPSLSSSIVRELIQRTPLHAAVRHPRLSRIAEELAPSGDRLDIGALAHRIFLEGEEGAVVEVEAESWRTKGAKALRDEARAAGKIALLSPQIAQARAMVEVLREQLDGLHPADAQLRAELTAIWQDDGVWCRARPDLLVEHGTQRVVYDFKTTGIAVPRWAERTYWDSRLDIQAAWYLRGLRACDMEADGFRYIVQETQPPYAAAVFEIPDGHLCFAKRDCKRAIRLWKRCLDARVWPAYPPQVNRLSMPAWFEHRHSAAENQRAVTGDAFELAVAAFAPQQEESE